MPGTAILAIDLGAESGRAILGDLDDGELSLRELHRFPNRAKRTAQGLVWDIAHLWNEVRIGIGKAALCVRDHSQELRSIGVDTWGVDFGLLDAAGQLIQAPHCYRDERNLPAFEKAIDVVGRSWLYEKTGIQFMPLNTLFQLVAQREADPNVLDRADRLLFIPDLFHYFLTGCKETELSIASTSQMLDPTGNDWSRDILSALDVPSQFLGSIVLPASEIGTTTEDVANELGLPVRPHVIAPASHDTASAVAAIPAYDEENWCFLSSGTWSLFGAELSQPWISDEARRAPFTNEKGINGSTRFLKNITGLWMVQECRRSFESEGTDLGYEELTALAEDAMPFRTLLDTAFTPFSIPGQMPEKIREFACRTGQPEPQSPGEFVRCCLESLALGYRETLRDLERILNRRFDIIHVVGGGGRNDLLNRMTADATGCRLIVGPFEATAAGNILVQAIGLGLVKDRSELRAIVRQSFDPEIVEPGNGDSWDDAYVRFRTIRESAP